MCVFCLFEKSILVSPLLYCSLNSFNGTGFKVQWFGGTFLDQLYLVALLIVLIADSI